MFSLILLLTLLSTALSIGALKRLQQLMQNLIPVNRIYSYFFNKTFLPDLQKEFRILGMFQLMDNRIRDLNKETFHWLGRMRSLEARTSSVQAVLQYLTAAVAMIYEMCIRDRDCPAPQVRRKMLDALARTQRVQIILHALAGGVLAVIEVFALRLSLIHI